MRLRYIPRTWLALAVTKMKWASGKTETMDYWCLVTEGWMRGPREDLTTHCETFLVFCLVAQPGSEFRVP